MTTRRELAAFVEMARTDATRKLLEIHKHLLDLRVIEENVTRLSLILEQGSDEQVQQAIDICNDAAKAVGRGLIL